MLLPCCYCQGGPLFGEHDLNATDASIAPKLYHALTALNHYKVGFCGTVVVTTPGLLGISRNHKLGFRVLLHSDVFLKLCTVCMCLVSQQTSGFSVLGFWV